MASDPQDDYVQILTANLQRTLDFLKFAEAKNAALLALASAWIGATLNLECNGKTLSSGFAVSISFALLWALGAGLLAMISFLPRLNLPSFLGGKKAGPHPRNLLFFGDISALSVKELEVELPTRYLAEEHGYRKEYIHDLTVQLSVNSCIAMRKMQLFKWGVRLMLLAAIALLLPSLKLAFEAARTKW